MLETLDLHGFKSFADRTVFRFAPGLTAVVGPNGSGKSNVVDALKWILGDQSPKSLRGKDMTDVIFNGSGGRKPANLCEAVLTFDNASGFLPDMGKQVAIGRRLWRNGDSEYLVDGQVARLKDVREIFSGTGAGASAYAIIEQGRVDQLLQANAVGRRAVFEEAAGVGRYKLKRIDAERKLERVEQNLARLTDIVDEVEAQLHATRTQAAKAAKFREISEELRHWWHGFAADEYRDGTRRVAELREKLAVDRARQSEVQQRQQELEDRLTALEEELAAADDDLRGVERQRSVFETQFAEAATTVAQLTERAADAEQDLIRARGRVVTSSDSLREAETERAHNREVLENAREQFETLRSRTQAQEASLFNLDSELAELRETLHETQARRTQLGEQIAQDEADLRTSAQRRDDLDLAISQAEQRLAPMLEQLEHAKNEAKTFSADVAECELRCEAAKAAIEEAIDAKASVAERRSRLKNEIAELRERRGAAAARLNVLEDFEQRGEGLGIGVREILNRARSIDDAPWNRIHGTVAELIDVGLDDAPLAEVALGSRAQLIVIDGFSDLAEYLHRRSSRIAGRVGFLSQQPSAYDDSGLSGARYIEAHPVGTAGASSPPGRDGDLAGLPGVVRRADTLIRVTPRFEGLAERLLGDTWVVESLNSAFALSAGYGRGMRFVTLQGELLESDGSLIVGTLRGEVAIVSRRAELLELRRKIAQYDRELRRTEAELTRQSDALRQADRHASEVEIELRTFETQLAEAKRSAVESDRKRTEVEAAAVEAETELERLAQNRNQASATISRAESSIEQCRAQLAAALELHRSSDAQIAQKTDEVERLREQQKGELLTLAKAEERLASLNEGVQRVDRDVAAQRDRLNSGEERLVEATSRISQLQLAILNAGTKKSDALAKREQLDASVREQFVARDRLKARRAEIAKDESKLRAERREQGDRIHETELKVREIEQSLSTMGERIREEYGVELEELAESDESAVKLLLKERQPEPDHASELDESSELDTIESPDSEVDETSEANASEAEEAIDDGDSLTLEEVREELDARVQRLRRKLKTLGSVNADSLADLDELQERYDRLSAQLQDLTEAKRALEDVIRRINKETKRLFSETFDSIRGHFQVLFRQLFGGGEGDIVLEDVTDMLECGIEIVARPPGKELRSLSLLSGGEKTMTCVALLLAIFKSKPSPFCILDEVDAALDEANITRFVRVLKEFKKDTQFIMITHRKPSMCEADVLYGVTMEEAGVSKRMSVHFEDVAEDGSFHTSKKAA
ncbi:chromosome segregation protein SMC [Stratiformator vulcanicus]|uniref:Chromosome partition protein Smc n=1 Tax=Stratiformator vulcanicus TaxID=2527980 RepID=A0A517R7J6_9PLAN|nr:chromosome segregation protein SMC [Stratiformator vulcanicus]QDT39803.1 Chromosome partition protein Smc [Stratiformator vulcanicus]